VTAVAGSASPGLRARLADALAGRSGADGVRWALRAAAPRAALRRELAALLPPGQPLVACRLVRAKFKPGRRLNAWYDLDLGPAGRRAVAVTWEPWDERADPPGADGQAARARRAGGPAEQEMEAEARAEGLAEPFTRLRTAAPALGLRAQVAPLDPTHPHLVRLSSPRRVPELLRRAGVPAAEADGWTVAAVRYRPGQRHVLRWQPAGGAPLFAKLYRGGHSARAARVAGTVADLLDHAGGGIAAARPLAHLPAEDALVYPLVPGRPLTGALGRPSAALAAHLAQAGAVLRALHAAPAALAGDLPPRTLEDDARELDRAAGHVRFLLPAAGAGLDELLGRVRELDARLGRQAPVFTHGDYKADHLWGAGERLTVLDFNTCSLAEPALDLGKLMADLRWCGAGSARFDPAWALRHLLEGYGPAGRELLPRIRLYEALVLAKITVRRVRIGDPDWAARTAAVLARAGELAGELEADTRRARVPQA